MNTRSVAELSARFGTEVPAVLWTPPDPRRGPGPIADEPAAGGELDGDEITALEVLSAPQVRIEARATGTMDARLCLARSGHLTARVVRAAGTATVDLPHCDGTADRLAVLVAPVLGTASPADPAVAASFPAEAGRAALRAGDEGEIAAALRAIGVDADAARLIGRVFARSRRSVEFTVHAGAHRCGSVVAVIDSPAGRVVVRTAGEPDAGTWISVAEGSAHRIGRALRRACEELPGGGWTP
ncbi:ESX secretion-associated protein EspG [Tsukamurella sputi]|uniref:ESX secretion-associated protein EspG n=1 Tax=Tsukamurella sputi TaxID=2591848 RepID=UPI001315A1ED|nr:ESX secretion-associated protein EspG [Tsukamurella sputi]